MFASGPIQGLLEFWIFRGCGCGMWREMRRSTEQMHPFIASKSKSVPYPWNPFSGAFSKLSDIRGDSTCRGHEHSVDAVCRRH